ncbi:hypothetical protein ABPG77_011130 [Micractinium sp. CCAP 211/92]
MPAAVPCGLTPAWLPPTASSWMDCLLSSALARQGHEGRLHQLLQQGLHGTVQQVTADAVLPGSLGPSSSAAQLQPPAATVQSAAAGAAAGLTPELAASFMMLMHRLPPGERAEKEAQLRALLGWGLHGAAAQAMATALHFGVPAAGGAP